MSISLDKINDPRLRQRIEQALAVDGESAKDATGLAPATRRPYEMNPAPVPLEAPLHDDVMAWCDRQQPWPWMYVHARMDKESTIGEGVADFVIFGPYPLCLVMEAKARDEKQKPKQLLWAAKMARIGWRVYVFRSMEEFLEIVNVPAQRPPATGV